MSDEKNQDKQDELNIDDAMDFGTETVFVKAPEPPATEAAEASPEAAAGMDQVRGILLGPLANELQMKMTQLSQRLDGSMLELDRRTADRVTDFETRFKEGMDAMVAELAELREEQATVLGQVRDELEAGTQSVNEKIEEFSATLTEAQAAEVQQIRTELEHLSDSITERLEINADGLRSEMVDRDAMATAFSEVAMRLSGGTEMIVAETSGPDMDLEAAIEAAARNS